MARIFSRRRDSRPALIARLLLVLAALALVWFAQRRYEAWERAYQATLRFELLAQLEWLGIAALAGLAFGLAAWPPRRGRYRWKVAVVLAILPLLLIAHYFFVYALALDMNLPSVLERPTPFASRGPLFVLPAFVGLAFAAGFSHGDGSP